MTETTDTSFKSKSRHANPSETPKLELPKFDVPVMEVPVAVREMAEKGVAQAKDAFETFRSSAGEANEMIEHTYAVASKGASEYGLKCIAIAHGNAIASLNYFGKLMTVKSPSEAVTLSTAHARAQFDALTAQCKELAALAQRITNAAAEPLKESASNAFNKNG